MFFSGLFFTLILAALTYIFVEKPAIDARRVFKTKWQKLEAK